MGPAINSILPQCRRPKVACNKYPASAAALYFGVSSRHRSMIHAAFKRRLSINSP